MEKKLTLGSFVRSGPPGSFGHVFTHQLEDGGEICLESCLNGYCVARYDKAKDLIGEKECTNVEGMELMQIAPGFSMGTGEALMQAVEIANKLI
jgi:hypothetical protein